MARVDILEEINGVFEENKEYKFQVKEIGDRVDTTKSHYRKWVFSTFIDGNAHDIFINLFPWQVMPIVEAMGAVKVDGKIKIDYDDIEGKSVYATVFSEKSTGKDGKEYTNKRLKDFRKDENADDDVPF
jgi:hypothetical protein